MKNMMRILGGLLILLMLGGHALAQEGGQVVQSACNIVKSGEYDLVYCFAQVHNGSDEIICLDKGNFQIMNGEEQVAEGKISRLWPYFLNPGEDGYLFDMISIEAGETPTAVTGIQYNIEYMTIESMYGGQTLETQARIECSETNGMMSVICELSNPTDTDVYDAAVAFGLYTDAGQLVYADGMRLKDIGIPAGGRTLVRFAVEERLTEQWRSYDMLPDQVRMNAMFSVYED